MKRELDTEEDFQNLDMENHSVNATIHESVKKRFRQVPPSHYTIKIKSFSLLLESKLDKYETNDFEAGGYKWRLVLYPDGMKKEDGNHHVSLFLAIANPKDISLGCELHAIVNFFVFDQIRDRYLVIEDADKKEWRFHRMKSSWGFTKFLPFNVLNDPSNGYMVNDCCIFGAEVFVVKTTHKGESLSLIKEPRNCLYTWNIAKYSALKQEPHKSDVFTVEGRKWHLTIYPKGQSDNAWNHLSLYLYLALDDSEALQTKRKLFAKFKLKIRDRTNRNHCEETVEHWFDAPGTGYGFRDFMLLSILKDPSKGYLVNDCMIIEVKFEVVLVVNDFS